MGAMRDVNGIGVGLRVDMAKRFLAEAPEEVRFVEVHPENYVRRGGLYRDNLDRARERVPVVTHGLTMCFGCPAPFEREYLEDVKGFLAEVDAPWHSDHLCFAGADGAFVHDLLPIPFTDESAATCAQRIREARDVIDRELAFENVSYYAPQSEDPLDEARFCVDVLERADCKMLLDVNNVFVNSRNLGFDPEEWIAMIPPERVVQIHVAGHLIRDDGLRIDTHGEAICDGVYALLEHTLRCLGPRPVLLERDNNIPALEEILAEVRALTEIYERAVGEEAA